MVNSPLPAGSEGQNLDSEIETTIKRINEPLFYGSEGQNLDSEIETWLLCGA